MVSSALGRLAPSIRLLERFDARISIQHLVRGSASGTFDDKPAQAEEGSVYGIDFARPATIEEREAVRLVPVTIERATAVRMLPDLSALHGLVPSPTAAAPYLRRLYALVEELDTLTAARAHAAAADLIASLAFCLGATAADDGTGDRWSAKRRAASAFIDAHIADRKLTPDRIADGPKISRSLLSPPSAIRVASSAPSSAVGSTMRASASSAPVPGRAWGTSRKDAAFRARSISRACFAPSSASRRAASERRRLLERESFDFGSGAAAGRGRDPIDRAARSPIPIIRSGRSPV